MHNYIFIFIVSLAYSLTVCRYAEPIAKFLKVVDHPGTQDHKRHTNSTPLVGGIACIPPAAATLLFQAGVTSAAGPATEATLAMAFATSLSFLVGMIDDRKHIPALSRLLVCGSMFFCALLICPEFAVTALTIETVGLKIELGWLALPFSVLCLLAFQNAVNMADGRDGLVAGISIIWLLTLLSYGEHPSNFAATSLLIGLIIVLHANLRGRLFLGDAGTYGLGASVGLMTIWIHRSNIGLHTVDVAVILAIPVLDMTRLFASRLANGASAFAADHNHLHHLIDSVFGWRSGRYAYYAIVALPIALLRTDLISGLAALALALAFYAAAILLCQRRSILEENL